VSRLCCPPSCCGGAKGTSVILAVLAAAAILAVWAHLAVLAVAAGVLAGCGVTAVAVAAVLTRIFVRPPAFAAEPEPYRVTATVIPQALQAEQAREVPGPAPPALENHVHYHLHLADERIARVLAAGYQAGAAEGRVAGYAAGYGAAEVEP
jgi:hypothetical protein